MVDIEKRTKIRETSHHSRSVVWGLILVIVGFVFLLINTGLVSPSIWQYTLQYWPILLVIAGLQTMMGEGKIGRLITGVVTIMSLVLIFLIAMVKSNSSIVYDWGLNKMQWFMWLINNQIIR